MTDTTDGENPIALSIIVPVFNEEALASSLCKRLASVATDIADTHGWDSSAVELLLINDGSRDDTLAKLRTLTATDARFMVVDLSRNHGHQLAITAGMDYCRGTIVTIIDGDLQDPPEVIAELLLKLNEGYDVVYAVRRHRPGETWFKLASASLFYRLLRKLTSVEIPVDTGDFRIMRRPVVDALCRLRERHRFVRGLVSWVGFRQTGLVYDRAERTAGETKYPLRKMFRFAVDGITSFSSLPLRFASLLGVLSSFAGSMYALYVIFLGLFSDDVVSGWASLMAVVLILGGIQLLCLGLLGEYVGRVSDEVKQRPLYFVSNVYRGGEVTLLSARHHTKAVGCHAPEAGTRV